MDNVKRTKLQQKLFSTIQDSPEFKAELQRIANDICNIATTANSEKTIESFFECNLYALLQPFGIPFNPEKEAIINGQRHKSYGRADSRIGNLIIEYKHPTYMNTAKQKNDATVQIVGYLEAEYNRINQDTYGFLTDGKVVKTITITSIGTIQSPFEKITGKHLSELIRNILYLDVFRLTPKTLISDLCESNYSGPIYRLARIFFNQLLDNPSPKTKMLRLEWEEIFRLGHDDYSQQTKVQQRQCEIRDIFKTKKTDVETEYSALFALYSAYAVVIKLMAYKVVSEIQFGKTEGQSLDDYESHLAELSDALRIFCADLEDGAIFRNIGILNLLEGDFFSWYTTQQQWNEEIANAIKELLIILSRYIGTKDIFTSIGAVDLFRELYEKTVPQQIRSSFGEFYTPYWLAEHVLNATSPSYEDRIIDPCCGSGTFLIAAISRIRKENQQPANTLLKTIISRVVGIDINPLAVLTARVNYFIHIADLLSSVQNTENEIIIIPIFLGDACKLPNTEEIDQVNCFITQLSTLKETIDITIPCSVFASLNTALDKMQEFEEAIKNQNFINAVNILNLLIPNNQNTPSIKKRIEEFITKLIALEHKGWNGIWGRIISNIFATASLGKFDAIIGNPPWVDWKNLPSGYRTKIKEMCITKGLFSGDRRTGGINLNICALLAYQCATQWLKPGAKLGFLMPKELTVQQSYEGWRLLMNGKKFGFTAFYDWSNAGHPFDPVKEDFLTYIIKAQNGPTKSIPVYCMNKKPKVNISECRTSEAAMSNFEIKKMTASSIISNKTILTFAPSKIEMAQLSMAAGESFYIGREGIEFFPQELLLFHFVGNGKQPGTVFVKNFQSTKSKYTFAQRQFLLETKYLFPLIKGPYIKKFSIDDANPIFVAFPYKKENPYEPITTTILQKESPLLCSFFRRHKTVFESQTTYSDKIRSGDCYYGLARTGPYSFANNYVCFRDNTKWAASVVSLAKTPWNESKRYLFQNHAVSICERKDGRFITSTESHYICGILNAPIVEKFILASSDTRSFKIRLPVFIPQFQPQCKICKKISTLSKAAHKSENKEKIASKLDEAYKELCKRYK